MRLAALDLDGTLLRTDGSVSQRTRRALAAAQAADAVLVIVTARSPRTVSEIAKDLGIGGFAVCANGATVYDLDADQIVAHRPLPVDVARRIARRLRESAPGVAFGWEIELRFGSDADWEALRLPEWPRPPGSQPVTDIEHVDEPLTKLLAKHPILPQQRIYELAVAASGSDAAVYLAGEHLVEISAVGVSKAEALASLCAQLEIAQDETVAFGDYLVDLPMLEWAGRSVAPANAHPDVLAAADEITAANDEDGVALVLERIYSSSSSASVGA